MAKPTKQVVLDRLKDGWELANRGRGWWLTEPRKPYKPYIAEQVEDRVVHQLIAEGVLTTDLPYNTLFARLTDG